MPVYFKNKSSDQFQVKFLYSIRLPEEGGGSLSILPHGGVTGGANVHNQYVWHEAELTLHPRPTGKAIAHPIHKPYLDVHRTRLIITAMTNLRTGATWQFPNKFGWYRVSEGGDLVGVRPSRVWQYNYGIGPVVPAHAPPPVVAAVLATTTDADGTDETTQQLLGKILRGWVKKIEA